MNEICFLWFGNVLVLSVLVHTNFCHVYFDTPVRTDLCQSYANVFSTASYRRPYSFEWHYTTSINLYRLAWKIHLFSYSYTHTEILTAKISENFHFFIILLIISSTGSNLYLFISSSILDQF